MKMMVAVDSFKSTLTSTEISNILKAYYEKQGHKVKQVPISDGGEGFIDALNHHFNEELMYVDTYGPLGDPIRAAYIISNKVAYIELSSTSGLDKIDIKRLNPMLTTTYGLGIVVKDAIKRGCKKIVVGIGGSATSDAASGMLQALGVKFYKNEKEIKQSMNAKLCGEVSSIDTSLLDHLVKDVSFHIASDVKNPLLGSEGSSHIYARQKGADRHMIERLEAHMKHFAKIVEDHFKKSFQFEIGAGAAGGFGFGALAFLQATIHSGIDYMIEILDIESMIKDCDLVFSGEGKLDQQTFFGKAAYGIANIAKKHHKKTIGIFAIKEADVKNDLFDEIYVIVPKYANEKTALNMPKEALTKMIEDIKIQK